MKTKNVIKKLSILLGLFLTALGSISSNNNELIIGIVLTILGEVLFLIK